MIAGKYIAGLRRVLGLGRRAHPPASEELQADLVRALGLVVDPRQLHDAIMGYLIDLYRSESAILLLWDAEANRLQERWRTPRAAPGAELLFEGDGRFVRWLQVNEEPLQPLACPDIIASFSRKEQDALAELHVELCIPMLAMSRLVGLVLLIDLPAGEPVVLAPTVRAQVGLALQNASLYAQQQVRLRRLSRAERLATTGELAASAAHEIRNPLTAISSAVQLLGEAFPAGNPRREIADSVMLEIDRINEIVEGLLSFARPPRIKRETIRLGEVVEGAVALISSVARKASVDIRVHCEVERDVLRGDRDQLVQVFVNLLMNGIQAMPEGGCLEVRITRPRRLQVEVRDTGPGMTTQQLERAFDPFYTTKEKGTGLGLPICYGIVRSHNGDIDVESVVGRGTTIRVEF